MENRFERSRAIVCIHYIGFCRVCQYEPHSSDVQFRISFLVKLHNVPAFIIHTKGVFIIVTLKDIAKTCDVSVSTVSRAFDKTSRISEPVRQRILTCATEMGYTPNLIARSLKSNRTMTLALIIPSIENRFYIDVLKHLEIQAHQYGYRLLVSFIQPGITTERECLEIMTSAQVDGIIMIPEHTTQESYLTNLRERVGFIQLFSDPYESIDSVVMDDNGGAEAGVDYLIRHNHRRILFVGGENRRIGFWRGIDKAGISHDEIHTLRDLASPEEIIAAIKSFRPTAIFSVGDSNECVWNAIQTLELSIPNDISVIVYDNTKWVSLVGLTAIGHNLEQIARTVIQQLLKRLNGGASSPPVHIVLDPFIVERKSVKTL